VEYGIITIKVSLVFCVIITLLLADEDNYNMASSRYLFCIFIVVAHSLVDQVLYMHQDHLLIIFGVVAECYATDENVWAQHSLSCGGMPIKQRRAWTNISSSTFNKVQSCKF
jgi:hypothetical protein